MNDLKIIDLDENNIHQFISQKTPTGKVFIAFLAPWCGHCKMFGPEWKKTKENLRQIKDTVSGHIITVDDKLMQQLPFKQPDGFPTLSLYEDGEHKEDYSGGRNNADLMKYLTETMNKPSTESKNTLSSKEEPQNSVASGKKPKKTQTKKKKPKKKKPKKKQTKKKKRYSGKSLQWGGKKRSSKKKRCKRMRAKVKSKCKSRKR